jgi:alpha-glucosidase (family GH31 glycosyl hydrolase)
MAIGPTSIGFDLTFTGAQHVYGLPEHATPFSLKSTRGDGKQHDEPYRLYNFDVWEYEMDSPMGLYGSVPFLMAHKPGKSTGALFVNAAEMWIDIEKSVENSGNRVSAIMNRVLNDAALITMGLLLIFLSINSLPSKIPLKH